MTVAAPAGQDSGNPGMGAPGGAMGSPQAGAPSSGMMATPQKNLGEQMKAKASIEMAMKVLYMSGAAFDPMSEESKAIRKAMDVLSKAFQSTQHEARELVPNEIASLMSGMQGPQRGGAGMPGIPGGTQGAAAPTAGGVT